MIEDAITKLCPNALVSKNCKSVTVLVPEDFENIQDIVSIVVDNGLEANIGKRTKCEVWTRIMGYYRRKADANPGKQSEMRERKYFSERAAFQSKRVQAPLQLAM